MKLSNKTLRHIMLTWLYILERMPKKFIRPKMLWWLDEFYERFARSWKPMQPMYDQNTKEAVDKYFKTRLNFERP